MSSEGHIRPFVTSVLVAAVCTLLMSSVPIAVIASLPGFFRSDAFLFDQAVDLLMMAVAASLVWWWTRRHEFLLGHALLLGASFAVLRSLAGLYGNYGVESFGLDRVLFMLVAIPYGIGLGAWFDMYLRYFTRIDHQIERGEDNRLKTSNFWFGCYFAAFPIVFRGILYSI